MFYFHVQARPCGLHTIDIALGEEDVRKPIVAVVYAVSCALAVCGGFVVAQSTHQTTPENAAQLVNEAEDDLFGPEGTTPAGPSRGPGSQSRPQPGLQSSAPQEPSEPRETTNPDGGPEAGPQGEDSETSSPEPQVAPANSGPSGNSDRAPGGSGRISPVQPQRIPVRPETRHAPPPAPAAEPPEIPQIPFPTLTINELPVNPPKPEPLRPLPIG